MLVTLADMLWGKSHGLGYYVYIYRCGCTSGSISGSSSGSISGSMSGSISGSSSGGISGSGSIRGITQIPD